MASNALISIISAQTPLSGVTNLRCRTWLATWALISRCMMMIDVKLSRMLVLVQTRQRQATFCMIGDQLRSLQLRARPRYDSSKAYWHMWYVIEAVGHCDWWKVCSMRWWLIHNLFFANLETRAFTPGHSLHNACAEPFHRCLLLRYMLMMALLYLCLPALHIWADDTYCCDVVLQLCIFMAILIVLTDRAPPGKENWHHEFWDESQVYSKSNAPCAQTFTDHELCLNSWNSTLRVRHQQTDRIQLPELCH